MAKFFFKPNLYEISPKMAALRRSLCVNVSANFKETKLFWFSSCSWTLDSRTFLQEALSHCESTSQDTKQTMTETRKEAPWADPALPGSPG